MNLLYRYGLKLQIIIEHLSYKKSYLVFEVASVSFSICSIIRRSSDKICHSEIFSLFSLSNSNLNQVIIKFLFPKGFCFSSDWSVHDDFTWLFVFLFILFLEVKSKLNWIICHQYFLFSFDGSTVPVMACRQRLVKSLHISIVFLDKFIENLRWIIG